MRQDARLARPGSRNHEERAFGRQDGLPLGGVQVGEVGLRAGDGQGLAQGIERLREPPCGLVQSGQVRRFEHDLDLGAAFGEVRIGADEHGRPALGRLDEQRRDRRFPRLQAAPPRADRRLRPQLVRVAVEHRLHLARKTREDPGVLDAEPGRAAERVLERTRARGQRRPRRHVVRVAGEASAEVGLDLRKRHLRHGEGGRDRLPRDVVGRPAESARDDQVVDGRRLTAHEVDDPVELVRDRRADRDLHAELLEPAAEPRGIGVLGVAGHDLVPDRQDGGKHMPSIREVEPERDAEGLVALEREARPTIVISPASWLHRELTVPARARLRAWVAEDDARIVGESYALLTFFSETSEIALVNVTVTASHRRRGLGAQLFELAAEHAAAIGAKAQLAKFYENAAGVAFARARGFTEVRAEAESAVDPRTIGERPAPDVDLRTVAEVDPKLVHAVDLEATHDMPSTEPVEDIPYDEWEQHVLQHPLFTAEGSFVAMVGGVAAAVSLIITDRESGRATSMFTGTLRAYRGRGLARAVKLASIEWLVANGITQLVTTNDETNAPMLAVNRRLGYRPAGRRVDYLRPAETTSASASV